MRSLTIEELDIVAGGLTDRPKEKPNVFEQFFDWISSWFDGSSSDDNASSLPTLTGSDLGQMQRDCLDHGGDFSIQAVDGSAGASFKFVDANGEVSYVSIKCDVPNDGD